MLTLRHGSLHDLAKIGQGEPGLQPPGSRDAYANNQVYPVWTTVLLVVGGLIMTASVVGAAFVVVAGIGPTGIFSLEQKISAIAIGLAPASAAMGLGLALVVAARSGRPRPQVSRLKLWAKLTVLFGLTLCISATALIYGVTLSVFTYYRILGTSEGAVFLHPSVLGATGSGSAIPVLIGLAMVIAGWFLGRRPRGSKGVPDVFN
jgi:LPXTG-motif cell wall-anchored protein